MALSKENYRAYIFIETKRGRKPSEIFAQLLETGLDIPSKTTVFEWCKRFSEGRKSFHDDYRVGRPVAAVTPANIAVIQEVVCNEPRTSLRALADHTGLSKDTVRLILTKELHLRKVCSTWIPHLLSESNKQERMTCAENILKMFESFSVEHLQRFWVTQDESWFCFDTSLTKQQNKAWLHPSQEKLTVVRPKLTSKKVLLLVAFTADKKISIEHVESGETVNAARYVEFVRSTGERWRHVRRGAAKLCELLWQHDNARPHTARETVAFFQQRNVNLIRQSPYSPDFNFCDRWIFKVLKKAFRGMTFQNGEEVRGRAVQILRDLSEDKYLTEMNSLRDHCSRVLACNGEYVI